MPTRRTLVLALGGAISLAGCTSSDAGNDPTDADPSTTGRTAPAATTVDDTPTQTETPEETTEQTPEEDTPEETTEQTPEDTPTPQESDDHPVQEPDTYEMSDSWTGNDFEEIYQEEMIQKGESFIDGNVNDILAELEDLDPEEDLGEFVAHSNHYAAGHSTMKDGAKAAANMLHRQGINLDQAIIKQTTYNGGQQTPMAITFFENESGGYQVQAMRPFGENMLDDPVERWTALPNKGETSSTVGALLDSFNDNIEDYTTPSDFDDKYDFIFSVAEGINRDGISWLNRTNDNLVAPELQRGVIGYSSRVVDVIGGGEEGEGILDFQRINENPESIGQAAYNFTRMITNNAYREAVGLSGDFLEVEYMEDVDSYIEELNPEDEQFYRDNAVLDLETEERSIVFTRVGQERYEELEEEAYPKLTEWAENNT